jgi:hypothetical protein
MFMKKILYIFALTIIAFTLKAQEKSGAKYLIDKINTYNNVLPIEKLYVSFDKHYYFVGDTIWFKTYLLDANYIANAKSNKVYIELVNDSSSVVDRLVIPLTDGIGWGDLILKSSTLKGNYTIRAYTNLQQNLGEDFFFTRRFSIGKPDEKSWMLSSAQKINLDGTTKTVELALKLSNFRNEAIGLKNVEVYLKDGKKSLFQANLQTSLTGQLNTSFKLPSDKNSNLQLIIQNKLDKTQNVTLPLSLADDLPIDLQFMPEGGNMLVGYYGKVAFKAINSDGLGINVKGKIIDSKNKTITNFKSLHNGMGSFFLLPEPSETYTAIVDFGNDKTQSFQLPLAQKSGTNLRIDNTSHSDSLYIYVKASADKRTDEIYPLIAQNGNLTVYAVNINLKNGFFNAKMPKKDFPEGITHFTLFAPNSSPLNERIIMRIVPQQIKAEINMNKAEYQPMDSIALQINFSDELTKSSLRGSYSVSVTDDSQLKPTSENSTIISHYLLNSNLKGNIEEPSYYFKNADPATLEALDHLLLTQGWIGYDWKKIMAPQLPLKFKPEFDNEINGTLTNIFKKPISGMKVSLLSFGKTVIFTDTTSNNEGRFMFKNLPLIDSASYVIKVKKLNGGSTGANIMVDEFMPTRQIFDYKTPIAPWYLNTDSTLFNYAIQTEKSQKHFLASQPEGQMLKEVEIKGKQYLDDKYSDGWRTKLKYQINEEALKKIPRANLIDLLYERIQGFTNDRGSYAIGSTLTGPVVDVIIDNISTKVLGEDKFDESNRVLFNYLKAEDIKDIKVFRSIGPVFILITTRSGVGPFIHRSFGNYVYKPLPLHLPRLFYSPKYPVKPANIPFDLRSTLFWAPSLTINENGEAFLYFYAGTTPGNYTVTLEGTDLNGKFAYEIKKIKVISQKATP